MLHIISRRIIASAAVCAFVAGCSSSSSLAPSQSSSVVPSTRHAPPGYRLIRGPAVEGDLLVPLHPHPWNLPHVWPKAAQVMFVADPQDNQILLYDPLTPNPSPEGSITDGIDYPFGVAVDKKGNLYVANLLGGSPDIGSITVYPAGSSSPSLTITDGVDNPYGIGVDSSGDIFAANLGNDEMVGYKTGASSPFETVTFPSGSQVLGLGVDSGNNVWLGSDTNSTVYEVPAGSTTPEDADLSGLNGTISVAFGQKDQMFVSNFGGHDVTVYTYDTTSPAYTITNGIGGGGNGPTLNGLTHSDYYFQDNQDLNVVGYKKGKTTPFSTITGIPDPRGIAATPLVKK
jgi:hypothetical protein